MTILTLNTPLKEDPKPKFKYFSDSFEFGVGELPKGTALRQNERVRPFFSNFIPHCDWAADIEAGKIHVVKTTEGKIHALTCKGEDFVEVGLMSSGYPYVPVDTKHPFGPFTNQSESKLFTGVMPLIGNLFDGRGELDEEQLIALGLREFLDRDGNQYKFVALNSGSRSIIIPGENGNEIDFGRSSIFFDNTSNARLSKGVALQVTGAGTHFYGGRMFSKTEALRDLSTSEFVRVRGESEYLFRIDDHERKLKKGIFLNERFHVFGNYCGIGGHVPVEAANHINHEAMMTAHVALGRKVIGYQVLAHDSSLDSLGSSNPSFVVQTYSIYRNTTLRLNMLHDLGIDGLREAIAAAGIDGLSSDNKEFLLGYLSAIAYSLGDAAKGVIKSGLTCSPDQNIASNMTIFGEVLDCENYYQIEKPIQALGVLYANLQALFYVGKLMSLPRDEVISFLFPEFMHGAGMADLLAFFPERWFTAFESPYGLAIADVLYDSFLSVPWVFAGTVLGNGERLTHLMGAEMEASMCEPPEIHEFGSTFVSACKWIGKPVNLLNEIDSLREMSKKDQLIEQIMILGSMLKALTGKLPY